MTSRPTPKRVPFVFMGPAWGRPEGRVGREARGGRWRVGGGREGAKRQEELDSLSSHDSPRICMRGRLGPVEISIRRWLPRGIAYNTIYYGGPPARRNLNRAAWTPPWPEQ